MLKLKRFAGVPITMLIFAACGAEPEAGGGAEPEAGNQLPSDVVEKVNKALNSDQVLLCSGTYFTGSCVTLSVGNVSNTAYLFSGPAKSIWVGSGVRTVITDQAGYAGWYAGLGTNVYWGTLGDWGRNGGAWSIRTEPATWPDCMSYGFSTPAGWFTLFTDANYQGNCVTLSYGAWGSSVGYPDWVTIGLPNNSISSIMTNDPDRMLMIYDSSNYLNPMGGFFWYSVPDLTNTSWGNFDNRISSIAGGMNP